MASMVEPAAASLTASAAALAEAIQACADEGASALSILDRSECRRLAEAARDLTWRPARPVVGEGERQVLQDFELTQHFPAESPYRAVARLIDEALAPPGRRMGGDLLPEGFRINDLILQRYRAGSRGITPHRDHLRYRGLVALLIVAGDGRFCLCADRRGAGAREIPAGPGDLLLMRAPGLAGSSERPFHFLDRIAVERLSFGLRWDTMPAT
jgi:hypothetical protein